MLHPIRAVIVALVLILISVAVSAYAFPEPHQARGFFVPKPARTVDQPSYELEGLNTAATSELARRAAAWYAWAAAHPPSPAPLRAVRAARPPTVSAGNAQARSGVNWDAIAQCETGSQWAHVGYTTINGRTYRYEGGLGILHEAWNDFAGTDFAPSGDLATREEQIMVAERIYARHGLSGWGCKEYG